MLKYMYIDESGDLGLSEGSSSHIVISALLVDDGADLDRIMKHARRHKFKKELSQAHELKANNSSPEVISHFLKKINFVKNIKIFHVILDKKQLRSSFLKENRDKLYNFAAGKLCENLSLNKVDLIVRVDKSKGKQVLQEDFNNYFKFKLKQRSEIYKLEIYHSNSHSWNGLQFADLLAYAAYQKFARGNSTYFDLITVPQEVYLML